MYLIEEKFSLLSIYRFLIIFNIWNSEKNSKDIMYNINRLMY